MIGRTISHYRILEQLGAGGMGVVYKAHDTRLGRLVALKFLIDISNPDKRVLQRFEREARAASALNHRNICTVHELGTFESRPFLVLELLQGETLKQRLQKGSLAIDEILNLAIQITDALDTAHRQGVIHRDIKPGNIFVTERNEAKVLDFGVAKLAARSRVYNANDERPPATQGLDASAIETAPLDDASLTHSGSMMGTAAYMSPEQARGEELDARSDLFSVGAVLYEMATGVTAFSGNTIAMTFDVILNREPIPVQVLNPQVPESLRRVISRAIEKDRERRYESAAVMFQELRRIRAGESDSAQSLGSDHPPSRLRKFADSIAVLPFESTGGDSETEYLSEGIAASIINNLSQLETLRVIPRTTAFRYRNSALDLSRVGRELGVRVVLTGSVTERAGRVIVNAELIDSMQSSQIWGEKYDRNADDLLAVEREIAREIVDKLQIRLSSEEARKLTNRGTASPEAHRFFLRAMRYAGNWTPEGIQKGVEFSQQAIAADPLYAPAHSGLAYLYVMLGFFGGLAPHKAFPRAKKAALNAIEADGEFAGGHLSLGLVKLFYDWDWPGAEMALRRAVELSPNADSCHQALAFWLLTAGRMEEAIAELKFALELNPLSAAINYGLGGAYYWARKYDLAAKEFLTTTELDPSFVLAHQMLAVMCAYERKFAEAFSKLDQITRSFGGSQRARVNRGIIHALAGNTDAAHAVLSELHREYGQSNDLAAPIAAIHAVLDEPDEALKHLEVAFEERASSLAFLASAPEMDKLAADPRFVDLLRRIGIPNTK